MNCPPEAGVPALAVTSNSGPLFSGCGRSPAASVLTVGHRFSGWATRVRVVGGHVLLDPPLPFRPGAPLSHRMLPSHVRVGVRAGIEDCQVDGLLVVEVVVIDAGGSDGRRTVTLF